jgi:hypothetical protein
MPSLTCAILRTSQRHQGAILGAKKSWSRARRLRPWPWILGRR